MDIYDTYRSAIAIESVDGGIIEDVKISKVKARNTGNAIFIRLGARNSAAPPGAIRNISLSDLSLEIPVGKPDEAYEHAGPPIKTKANLIRSSITGLSDARIENITIKNVRLRFGGKGDRAQAELPLSALGAIPEIRQGYPEFSMFGELPAWGLFVRHVQNLRLENVSFKLDAPDFRAALVADDVHEFNLKRVKFHSAGEEPLIVLSSVSKEQFEQIEYPRKVHEELRVLAAEEVH